MKIFRKLFLLSFLVPLFSLAQSNYKPGYIITLKGDTLHGYIDYKEWENNPKHIAFKRDIRQGNADIFTTKAANAFAITGQQYYERYVVPVSQDPVDVSTMGSKLDTSYRTDTVFLRILNKGRYMALYGYRDDIKPRFYLLEAGQTRPQELIYHAYYNINESSSIQYVKRFHIQLQNIAQTNGINNDEVSREIVRCNYSETDLIGIAQKINGNSSKQFTAQKLFGIRWFAGAGANYSNFKFTGNVFSIFPASNSVSPKIDAGIDFFSNKNIQKFYLRAEVSFTYGQYSFSYHDNISTPSNTTSLDLKQYNTAITPQFIYNIYNKEQFKAFIDFGISINLASYSHYQLITKYDSFPTNTQDNYPEFENIYMTTPIKAGVAANKKFEVYVCYIPPVSITGRSAYAFRSNITSYQAGLNYLFGSK
jgi:hypothetical protein